MFLDVTSGLLSASAAFTTHYICNYLATPVEGKHLCLPDCKCICYQGNQIYKLCMYVPTI